MSAEQSSSLLFCKHKTDISGKVPPSTFRAEAWHTWPKAEWIYGSGPFALLAHCGGVLTVTLHVARDVAESAKRTIDETGCDPACTRHHEIVALRGNQ